MKNLRKIKRIAIAVIFIWAMMDGSIVKSIMILMLSAISELMDITDILNKKKENHENN